MYRKDNLDVAEIGVSGVASIGNLALLCVLHILRKTMVFNLKINSLPF